MDSLTQAVLGAAVAEAVIGKKEGNKAIFWGAFIGTIPDMDVFFARLYDPVKSLFVHRGFSHSILFTVLMAIMLGYLLKKIYKRSYTPLKQWMFMVFLVIGTHILLDCFTTYGTGVFEPFSSYRVEWSSIAIVDLFYTLPFIITVIATLFFKRYSKNRKIVSWAGIILSTVYLLATVPNKFFIKSTFKQQLIAQGAEYSRIKTFPLPLSNFLWMGIAEQKEGYLVGYHSLFGKQKDIDFEFISRNDLLLKDIADKKKIAALKRFSKGLYNIQSYNSALLFNDLRFGKIGINTDSPYIFSFKIEKKDNNILITQNDAEREMDEGMLKEYVNWMFGKE
jgi:inner membrane protein